MPTIAAVRYALEWNLLLVLTAFLAFAAWQQSVDMPTLVATFTLTIEYQFGQLTDQAASVTATLWSQLQTLVGAPDALVTNVDDGIKVG